MALTELGKNGAVEGATAKMKYVGLLKTLHEEALTSETISGTKLKLTGSEGKGFTNGKVVFLTEINGSTPNSTEPEKNKVAGLWMSRPYFVLEAATNEFALATERGVSGSIVTPSTAVKVTTKVALVQEVSGGAYKREATSFGAAAKGESADTVKKITVPASTEVTFAAWWEKAKAAGEETAESEFLMAGGKLEHSESFSGEGIYEITSDKVEGNLVA